MLRRRALLRRSACRRPDVAHHSLLLVCITRAPSAPSRWWRCIWPGCSRAPPALTTVGRGCVRAAAHRADTAAADLRRRLPLHLGRPRSSSPASTPTATRRARPQLARLRDTPSVRRRPATAPHLIAAGCTAINRPNVHTVYPPVAEAAFDRRPPAVLRRPRRPHAVPAGGRPSAPSLIACRAGPHRADAADARCGWSRFWAWCPVVVSEFGNNAHIDWLAVLLIACWPSARGCGTAAGWPVRCWARRSRPSSIPVWCCRHCCAAGRAACSQRAAAGRGASVYMPHVAAVGQACVGYLPGYLHEEGYSGGHRLLLLSTVLPGGAAVAGALVLAAAVALVAYRRVDPLHPERTAVHVAGARAPDRVTELRLVRRAPARSHRDERAVGVGARRARADVHLPLPRRVAAHRTAQLGYLCAGGRMHGSARRRSLADRVTSQVNCCRGLLRNCRGRADRPESTRGSDERPSPSRAESIPPRSMSSTFSTPACPFAARPHR